NTISDFFVDFSLYPQIGSKGNPVWLAAYYPSATWQPFTDTAIGSGEVNFTFGHQSSFSGTNNAIQAERVGLITLPNDWASDNFSWSTITYTHTLPGSLSWLSITGGQYNLFSVDPSEYAGNAQTTFISYSFAQDATQTFPNAGLGAYLQAKAPNGQFRAAGGPKEQPISTAGLSRPAAFPTEKSLDGGTCNGRRGSTGLATASTT